MKLISANVASVLALTAEYSVAITKTKKYKKQLEKIIRRDDPHGYGMDIFNALLDKPASEDAIATASGLKEWARSNKEWYQTRRKKK